MPADDQPHTPLTHEQFRQLQKLVGLGSRVLWKAGETPGVIDRFIADLKASSGIYLRIDWLDTGNGLPHSEQNIIDLSFLIDGEFVDGQDLLVRIRDEFPSDQAEEDSKNRHDKSPLVFEKIEIGGVNKQIARKNEQRKIFIFSAFSRGVASVAVGFGLFNANQLRSLAQQLIEAADELDANENFPFVK
jgi:hypothetical protein